jgi:hypothetical protein
MIGAQIYMKMNRSVEHRGTCYPQTTHKRFTVWGITSPLLRINSIQITFYVYASLLLNACELLLPLSSLPGAYS